MSVNISGVIGLTILKKNETKVLIFYDDHSNKEYCKNIDNYFINQLIEKITNDPNKKVKIFLEEPFSDAINKIKVLWGESKHLYLFRKYYNTIMKKCGKSKICYTYPVDIRLDLFEVSIEEIMSNLKTVNYFKDFDRTVIQYFKNILYLFDIIEIKNDNRMINFIKNIFYLYSTDEYYKMLKQVIISFYNKFIEKNKDSKINHFLNSLTDHSFIYSEGFPFNNLNEDCFTDQIDKIISGIMEFYLVILLNLKSDYKIIYLGYYHSNNITYILKKYYGYEEILSVGNTSNIESSYRVNSCIQVDQKYLDI
jgi:hypothetical protein